MSIVWEIFITTVLILISIFLVLSRFKFDFHLPKKRSSKHDDAEHDTTHASTSDNHKTQKADGHGSHGGHDDHHHESPLKKVASVLVTLLFIGLGLLAFMWFVNELFGPFGVAPGASSERRYELSLAYGAEKKSVTASSEWHETIAPPKGDLWSTWIDIPPGHTIYFCDMVRDPSCSALSFDDVEFIPQCRSLIDGSPLDWNDVSCRYTDANRVQAKGSKAMLVHYRFAPAP